MLSSDTADQDAIMAWFSHLLFFIYLFFIEKNPNIFQFKSLPEFWPSYNMETVELFKLLLAGFEKFRKEREIFWKESINLNDIYLEKNRDIYVIIYHLSYHRAGTAGQPLWTFVF